MKKGEFVKKDCSNISYYGGAKRRFYTLLVFTFLFTLLSITTVSAERLPVVDGDNADWGTILNNYLNKLAGPNATELNSTMVNGTNIYSSSINTTHLLDGTIMDVDISDTTNLTLGEKITFTFGEIIDNLVDGWITISGGLNVTKNLNVVGNTTIVGDLNVTGTSNLGSVTINSDNITLNNLIPKDNENIEIYGNLTPSANNTYSLGSLAKQWKDMYISSGTIYIGGVPLSKSGSNLQWNGGDVVSGSYYNTTQTNSLVLINSTNGVYIYDLNKKVYLNETVLNTSIYNRVSDTFLNLSGTNANQNINLSPHNLTANYFMGNGSLLTGIEAGLWTNSSGNATYTAGNVGIGTINPSAKLEVNGTIGISSFNSLGNDTGYLLKNVNGTLYWNGTEVGSNSGGNSSYGGAFYGSLKWDATTNCEWTTSSATFSNLSADADCDNNVRTARGLTTSVVTVGNSEGQIPQIKFDSMPKGYYSVRATGYYFSDNVETCYWRMSDGSQNISSNSIGGGSQFAGGGTVEGEFFYSSDQGATTFTLQAAKQSTNVCFLSILDGGREFEISVYYLPSFGTAKNDTVFSDLDGDTRINVDADGADSNNMAFFTNGTQRMVIVSNGRVGIGTSSPTTLFQVDGNVTIGSSVSNPAQLELQDKFSSGGKNLVIGDDSFFSDIDIGNTVGLYGLLDPTKGGIQLGNNSNSTIFGDNGKIGIGTSTPSIGLDIKNLKRGTTGDYKDIGTSFESSSSGASQAGYLFTSSNTDDDVWLALRPTASYGNQWMIGSRFFGNDEFSIGYGAPTVNMTYPLDTGSKFVITTGGKVGIATTSPTHDLTIDQNSHGLSSIGSAGLALKYNNNYYSTILTSSAPEFYISLTGNDGTNWNQARFGTLDSSWTFLSDERLKENITVIPNALDKVTSIRGVLFDWKKGGEGVGVIAQEVQPYMPRIVSEDENGYLGVGYASLTPYLVEAVKELKTQLDEKDSEIQMLKSELCVDKGSYSWC